MHKRLFILIPIVLSALMFVPSIPKAHALTGLVCITSPTATSCPTSAPSLGPYSVGTKFSVGVFIQNSNAMGGFDIYVKADSAVLNPTAASLGPLIASPTLTSICVNGLATTGSCTVSTANNPGVVEVTTIESSGGNECAGLSPCSGMAFFINYTVVGSAASTTLSYPTATSCSPSSVASPPNTCVLVADNAGTLLSENIQGTSVIQTSSPDFTITAIPNTFTVNSGSNASSNISLTSLNGLTGTVVFQTSATGPACTASCPRWIVSPATLLLPPVGSNSSRLIFFTNSTTQTSDWNVTVIATLGTKTHSASVAFHVVKTGPVPDFSISANPLSVIVPAGFSNSSIITLTSINGFSGTVTLSVPPPAICPGCPLWSVSPFSVLLHAGGTNSSTLTFTTFATTTNRSRSVPVTGLSAGLSHVVSVLFTVVPSSLSPDFGMSASPASVIVRPGSSNSSTLIFTSINGFSGTISITFVSPLCTGCSLFWQNTATLHSGGTNTTFVTLTTSSSTPTGPVGITMVGTSGAISHPVTVVFTVVSAGPPADFTISASPASLIVRNGGSNSSTITLTSVNGFSGNVFLSTSTSICTQFPCTTWSVNPSPIFLSAGGTANAFLTISGGQSPTNGTITITATSGGITHQTSVAFQIVTPPPDFSINTYPSFITIPAGATASSNVQVSSIFYNSPSFTVTLSTQTQPANGLTTTLIPTIVTVSGYGYSTLTITSMGTTPVGNYTITITGKSSTFTHTATVIVQVLPPPTIKLNPTSGPVGTKVLIQASNIIVGQYSTEVLVTFDDQLVGFAFTSNSSFNFTFNVPVAQSGLHTVKVTVPFFGAGGITIAAAASFQVTPTPSPSSLAVSIDVGTIYFPGDTAKGFILVTQNGQPSSPTDLILSVTLIEANGSRIVLTATKLSTGVYSTVFNIPTTSKGAGPLGTYALVASAHSPSLGDSTSIASFEVKPTWLASNGKTLVTGVTIAGVLGTLGVAWKKGYLRKKEDELFPAA